MIRVDRVTIDVDHDWETAFIPWLEDKEANNVGVKDGVFVATVAPALRFLQPEAESNFVMLCHRDKLSDVSTQHLTELVQKGVFYFESRTPKGMVFKECMKSLSHLQSFKTDTCCTLFLERNEQVDNLFNHIHFDVLNKNREYAPADGAVSRFKSIVLQEEYVLQMEEMHRKFSLNTQEFLWEKRQRNPPEECPDLECYNYFSDPEQSNENTNSGTSLKKTSKLRRTDCNDCENSAIICYGYGYESPDDCLKITPNLNLSRIYNMLWLLPYHYPGLHSTYLYFGTTHSFFPIHVEDALTWSLNYLHVGHPKVWVIIPPYATALLEFHLHKSCIFLDHTACSNILGHKSVLPTIHWLKERNIPFNVVVQRPGDLVVLYPSAAHFGFNLGSNIAQAINIATTSWIPWGINAKKCKCMPAQVHIDIKPLVTLFRKDLLGHLLHGGIVLTPAMLKGLQLVRDEVAKSSKVVVCKGPAFKCPANKCSMTFPQSDAGKQDMTKHVKSTHQPILEKCQLLHKINELF